MRVLLWNVRGLGKLARRGHIRDFIHTERIDIVGLQETVKSEFSKDLEEIGGAVSFYWFRLPAIGRSGEILLGVKGDSFEVEDHNILNYCIKVSLRNRLTNLKWEFIVVYGPAQHQHSEDFFGRIGQHLQH